MLKHLFKLMWNRKKRNLLLTVEIFVSFIVIFAISCFLIFVYDNYKKPLGFDPDNIRVVRIHIGNENMIFSDSIAIFHEPIVQALQGFKEIKSFSFSDFAVPYILGSHSSNIKYGKKQDILDNYFKDDNCDKVMGMQILKGRWFNKTDEDTSRNTIVITESVSNRFFGRENPIGKYMTGISGSEKKWNIVGVIADPKSKSDYLPASPGVYLRLNKDLRYKASTIMLKVTSEAGADFDNKLNLALSSIVKNASIDISSLSDARTTKNKIVLVPAIVFIIICCFLIFNVCLGLFGVLWYNINKRKSEIGLRKAIGASSWVILVHFIGEAWTLATLAIAVGMFFAVQFPLLHVFDIDSLIYIKGMICSILFIYFIVLLCALYPSRQASAVYPAMVLHEE